MGVRSFVAIECGNSMIIQRFSDVQRSLSGTRADIKFVEPENIHLTLKFLGEIEQTQVDAVAEIIKETVFEPFSFKVHGVGVFPNLRRPRTIWAGITEGVTELTSVFKVLDDKLSKLGFEKERRRFSPHLTISRVRTGRNRPQLIEELQNLVDQEFGIVHVDKIVLKKSVLTSKGPIYTTLAESSGHQ
ncbi:MAG: RNA 2',3'-cyclic phosphodiesterase [Candidatus Bathyarchaeota archaeon]|nr:RNA 2',3'-cyclic phosphodiesterase [Candidatus Bathyarchaeota archaeon]